MLYRLPSELLGKILVTQFDGIRSSGRIVETEAYAGVDDQSHLMHLVAAEQPALNICTVIRVPCMFIFVMACIICLM